MAPYTLKGRNTNDPYHQDTLASHQFHRQLNPPPFRTQSTSPPHAFRQRFFQDSRPRRTYQGKTDRVRVWRSGGHRPVPILGFGNNGIRPQVSHVVTAFAGSSDSQRAEEVRLAKHPVPRGVSARSPLLRAYHAQDSRTTSGCGWCSVTRPLTPQPCVERQAQ